MHGKFTKNYQVLGYKYSINKFIDIKSVRIQKLNIIKPLYIIHFYESSVHTITDCMFFSSSYGRHMIVHDKSLDAFKWIEIIKIKISWNWIKVIHENQQIYRSLSMILNSKDQISQGKLENNLK